MKDAIQGRLAPMPSDPEALHRGTKSVVLWSMGFWFLVGLANVSFLVGVAIGKALGS